MASFTKAAQQWATFARAWYLIDAKMQPPGKIAAITAIRLQGKHKPVYHALSDLGDHVVIINTRHIAFSGNKWEQKVYSSHTGYPGGFKQVTAAQLHLRDPTAVSEHPFYRPASLNDFPLQCSAFISSGPYCRQSATVACALILGLKVKVKGPLTIRSSRGRHWGCGTHLALLARGAGVQLPFHVTSMTKLLLANQSSERKRRLPSRRSGTYLSTCTLTYFRTAGAGTEQQELTPSRGFEPPTF
uniref:Large ribosomal subunit protein uL13m n=1 Tax=Podarcis muralis TaxID=64176 RepID=A0A670JWA4_PODMU